jgi:hypothetical protein
MRRLLVVFIASLVLIAGATTASASWGDGGGSGESCLWKGYGYWYPNSPAGVYCYHFAEVYWHYHG